MAQVKKWGDAPAGGGDSGGRFISMKEPGQYKVRFMGDPVEYKKQWPGDDAPKACWSVTVLNAQGEIKWLDMPATVYRGVAEWAKLNDMAPQDPTHAPGFVITAQGSGKDGRKYQITALAKPCPVSAELVGKCAQAQNELVEYRKGNHGNKGAMGMTGSAQASSQPATGPGKEVKNDFAF